MSKEETKKFFEELEKVDDSPDWDEVISVARNKNRYQIALIDELLEKSKAFSEGIREVLVRETLTIGPLLDDNPAATTYTVRNHIRESFLKLLERMDFIKNLNTKVEDDEISGVPHLIAQFGFIPSTFERRIKAWKNASEKTQGKPMETAKKKKELPRTDINRDDGYLLIGGEKIFIGSVRSGKFLLIETLCNPKFGTRRTAESVFEHIKTDRNKRDASYIDAYLGPRKKIDVIKSQFKEVQRAIRGYAYENGIMKSLLPQLSLKWDKDRNAWLEASGGT